MTKRYIEPGFNIPFSHWETVQNQEMFEGGHWKTCRGVDIQHIDLNDDDDDDDDADIVDGSHLQNVTWLIFKFDYNLPISMSAHFSVLALPS